MKQTINKTIWTEFAKEILEKKKKEGEIKIKNTGTPKTEWIRKVVEKVRISDIAREEGIDKCPLCNYDLYFDDSRGWFICQKKRWGGDCSFGGNIVDFQRFIEVGKW